MARLASKCRVISILTVLFFSVHLWAYDYVQGRVIVKLKGKASSTKTNAFQSKLEGGGRYEKGKSWPSFNMHTVEAKGNDSTEKMIEDLKNDPDVEYVEPDYILTKESIEESNTESANTGYISSQLQTFVSGFGLTSSNIQGVEAWAASSGSSVPVVAIIDTGIDYYHEALTDAVWTNSREIPNNGIDDDGNGYVDDVYGWNFADGNNNPMDCDGHGTHVSGIVRGVTEPVLPGTPAPNWTDVRVKLMAVKFLDCYGSGTTSNAISGIYYAVNNGAKILNNSWGGGGYSRALHEAIIYSYNMKTLFVAAAGNSSNNNDGSKVYPASYDVPNVLTVASVDAVDRLSYFSNYGASLVHVAAPGELILSTYYGTDAFGNYRYRNLSGTSMAAPFVTGLAALIAKEKPTMNGYQMKSIILSNSDHVSGLSGKVSSGSRINNLSVLNAGKAATVNSWQPDYAITISSDDRSLAGEIASGGAGGCGIVRSIADLDDSDGLPPIGTALVLSVLFMAPVLLFQALRKKGIQRRRYERFAVSTRVAITIADRTVSGSLTTISMGGVGVNTSVSLKRGSIVTLSIVTPDGHVETVRGKVVWSSTTCRAGIQFMEADSKLLEHIAAWTQMLTPAAS